MRKILLITALVFTIFSCKKDSHSLRDEIRGVWELEHQSSFPFFSYSLPPGNGNIIVLSEFGKFERRAHDTVLFKGTYHLKLKKDCYYPEMRTFFSTNDPDALTGDHTYIEIDEQ